MQGVSPMTHASPSGPTSNAYPGPISLCIDQYYYVLELTHQKLSLREYKTPLPFDKFHLQQNPSGKEYNETSKEETQYPEW